MERYTIFVFMIQLLIILNTSCSKNSVNLERKSSHGDTKSHITDKNCINCHKEGGSGDGWFTIAGTVFNTDQQNRFPNATVLFYSVADGDGDIKYTLEVDEYGNFYTTDEIDFVGNKYPVVLSEVDTQYMSKAVSNGDCSDCHGQDVDKIWVK